MTALIALGAVLATAGTLVAWLPQVGRSREIATAALLLGAVVLGCVAPLPGTPVSTGDDLGRLLPAALALLSVLGGSPVTSLVLRLADRDAAGKVETAAEVLQGGVWIGVFERTAIFATLLAGWPEGLAVVLALKGLGRYPELRGDTPAEGAPLAHGGVAERFIIGTFASALWAAGGAGLLVGLLG